MKKIKFFILAFCTITNLVFSAAKEAAADEEAFRYPRNWVRSPHDAIQRLNAEELVILDDGRESLPAKVDLRSYLPGFTINQGKLGSCCGCALARSIDGRSKVTGAPVINPAPLFLFYEGKRLENSFDSSVGISLYSAFKVAHDTGFCSENTWPYRDTPLKAADKPSVDAYREASAHKVLEQPGIAWIGGTLPKIKYALSNFLFPVFGMILFESFEDARLTGNVPVPKPSEKEDGGHAMVAVGYDDFHKNTDGSFGAIIAQGSWGPKWGEKGGFVYIPYKVAEQHIDDDCWAVNHVSGSPETVMEWKGITFRPADPNLRLRQHPAEEAEKASS